MMIRLTINTITNCTGAFKKFFWYPVMSYVSSKYVSKLFMNKNTIVIMSALVNDLYKNVCIVYYIIPKVNLPKTINFFYCFMFYPILSYIIDLRKTRAPLLASDQR